MMNRLVRVWVKVTGGIVVGKMKGEVVLVRYRRRYLFRTATHLDETKRNLSRLLSNRS